MANNNQEVLLRIKVDADKALSAVKQYTEEVESLKRTQKNLQLALKEVAAEREKAWQAYKKGEKTVQDYNKIVEESKNTEAKIKEQLAMNSAQLANTSQTLRGYQKELQNVYKQQEALANDSDGSLASLRAELSNVTKAFDNLSRVEREGAKGTEYLDKINKLTDEIKEAEEATQRYQRNVGNYKSALEGAEKAVGGLKDGVVGFITGGNPIVEMLFNTSQQLGSVKQGFILAKQGAVMLGKQMLALIATPIGAFLTLVTTLILAFKNGIASSEERMNRFKVVTAPLQGILDGVTKALGAVCNVLLTFVEWQSKAVGWVLKLAEALPLVGDAIAQGNEATREYIALEKERQELTRITRDEVVATAQREKEISDLRAKFAEKDKYTNQERLAFLEQAIALETEQAQKNKEIAQKKLELLEREAAMSDNDAEMNDKLAQAKAEVLRADKALSDKMREMNAQRVEAVNAINAEAEAQKRKAEEATKAELEAIRAAEDALNEIIENNYAKQRAILTTAYERQIEDIKNRLATETNLTLEAREALNTQMLALGVKYQQDLDAINADAEQRRRDAIAAEEDAEAQQRALNLATRIAELHGDEDAILQAKIDAKANELETMKQLEYESDDEFYLRKLEAQNAYFDMLVEQEAIKNQRLAEDEAERTKIAEEKAKEQRDAYNSVMNAMDAMGEHSKALGKVAKVMALAQIAVDTGKAISAGIAQATAAGPFPANLAAIATTVATVLANMASAISTVKSAKFASGGLVTGAGTGTSDSIPAMLSNGESVMTAEATSAFAPILSTLNQMGGGVPIQATNIGTQQMGEEMLARAVAQGVAQIQPVVSVEEFNRVSGNVKVIETMSTF